MQRVVTQDWKPENSGSDYRRTFRVAYLDTDGSPLFYIDARVMPDFVRVRVEGVGDRFNNTVKFTLNMIRALDTNTFGIEGSRSNHGSHVSTIIWHSQPGAPPTEVAMEAFLLLFEGEQYAEQALQGQ